VSVYVAEEFTSDEEDILRRYFTNLDRPVFALVNLPEVVKGALFARYSRSPKSLRRLFLDEFAEQLTDAPIASTVGLARAEKLSAVGELAASVVHVVKNPVAAIVGYAQLGRDCDGLPEAHELFGLVEAQAWRASDVLQNMLEFTRREPSRPELLDPATVAEDAVKLLRHPLRLRGVTVRTEIAPGLPKIHTHAGELQQVLVNLLMNAADAMEGRPERIVTIGSGGADGRVLLWVRDTGAGIDPEHLEKIFQPFFTTKKGREGTGLGLSVSQRIVRDLGGEIRVESKLGVGATFTVALPAVG